ncbi:hypothetical protein XM38_036190 [Halomicronema hongdechloris C2206]|uniref:Uncharacterized protein n=1 Tax=Halomicronema hongdechloris C2206 TaxID=1641165 RepID=A0A1Z3HQT0_9CYAN|nr:hypothetical protein [Halomicronema hongdechloris]ASC72661.1 hypothetical protein XM38_036190 [Halomicronema hongdechloris C2206]
MAKADTDVFDDINFEQSPAARSAPSRPDSGNTAEATASKPADTSLPGPPVLAQSTLELAAHDVRQVLQEQSHQGHILTTKLNILFVTNGALLTSLSISRLIISGSFFSVAEAMGFLAGFSLLMRAFLPRQVAITPNLEERKFLETYLALSYEEYQLQMMVNLAETYRANKQRLDDVSQTLRYAAYATWSTAVIMLVHIVAVYLGI